MTEFVRFNSLYEHTDPETKQRVRYPAGWSGEVDKPVLDGARKVGALPDAEKKASASPKAADGK